MDMIAGLDILFRWLHVIAACFAIGGAFFLRAILPAAIEPLDAVDREAALLRARRGFKMIVHPAIFVFLVTGAYNAWKNWGWYTQRPGVMHGIFGMHLIFGLAVIGFLLWLLSGRELRRSHANGLRLTLMLMLLAVLAASTLKWVRDHTPRPVTGVATTQPVLVP